ncbi:MAG: hypothetical protein PVI43_04805 [Candidatus Bathyarchaeota archaeon]|jgi:hypothetical protein
MKTKIGIFNGKQEKNNRYLLSTLYNSGPLSCWELARTVREKNLQSLYSIFNKRLRDLEKKGYVEKATNSKWVLKFKGIIAALVIQEEPKAWNEKWSMLFEKFVEPIIDSPDGYSIMTSSGKKICELKDFMKTLLDTLINFEHWDVLAKIITEIIERSYIKNLDTIRNDELQMLIVTKVAFDKELFHDYTQ